jgi:hypothetical protein
MIEVFKGLNFSLCPLEQARRLVPSMAANSSIKRSLTISRPYKRKNYPLSSIP